MAKPSLTLYEQLNRGPAVLFLGQNYLRLETGVDNLLTSILHKYGIKDETADQYDQIFHTQLPTSNEVFLSWINERSRRLAVPNWIRTVASFPWSNVYTSAFDTLWYRSFRTEWRDLYPIFEEKIKPSDPRSRTRLQCTFLFGSIDQPEDEPNKRPPLTSFEKKKRRQEAIALLRRLPEIVTPFGVLIVEGYDGNRDWLSLDDFLPIVDELTPGQTHIFSTSHQSYDNSDFSYLLSNGKITVYPESLASYLSKFEEDGYLKLGIRPDEKGTGQQIQIGTKILSVPSELSNLVARSATILDDSIFEPLSEMGEEKRYSEFRNFLADTSIHPIWSGYERGFNFQREFERDLEKQLETKIQSRTLNEEPIILHGQSGTGKTVALGALAYKIRREKRCAVLFIERKPQKPFPTDIDHFCKWAEDNGSPTTLVIWDGMVEAEQYYELVQFLLSRGRKVILVGSCYRINLKGNPNFIEAPSTIGLEFDRFKQFLGKIDPNLEKFLTKSIKEPDEYFLVALYRALPSTRRGIERGVIREVDNAEQRIIQKTLDDYSIPSSSLAFALYNAGFISKEDLSFSKTISVDQENVIEIQELIGLVMVPGRFGINVPFELILRVLGRKWMDNLVSILTDIDIFRWYEDNVGNILIGPRHPLEAQLIVQSRMGSSKTEVEYAKKLIIEIRPTEETDSSEIQFIVDLIRSMGPNGLFPTYFAPCFLDLANTLKELRNLRGVENPRLMLQEATLLREWIKKESQPPHNTIELLLEARRILEKALKKLESENRNLGLRSAILVEMGTNLASNIRYQLEQESRQVPMSLISNAKDCLYKAISLYPNDFHPYDVLYWMSENLLRSGLLDPATEAEISADILNAYSTVDPEEFSDDQRINYYQRQYQLGQLISLEDISNDAFTRLVSVGSKAGYYLRAIHYSGQINIDRKLNHEQINNFGKAIDYLEKYRSQIADDSRCLNLLLRLWWMRNTRRPIFYEERQTVKFTPKDWQYILNLTTDLLTTTDFYNPLVAKFLKALSLFHLNDVINSIELFQEIEHDSNLIRGKKRIIRSYLASTPEGNPREYQGIIYWVNVDQNRGEVYVPDLRRRIRFIPLDFARGREFRKDQPLDNFHIAFNFIGPIADPKTYWRDMERGE